jgi:peptidoglycan/LPS O-acetylase OafA/YrhL
MDQRIASGRSQPIDLLRAAAIILVIGRHLKPCPSDTSVTLHWLTAAWARGGWVGVDLFFVLSGFLVSGLLFREFQKHGRIAPGRFFARRGFKIYPAFWIFMLATVIVLPIMRRPIAIKEVLSELLFVQNYLPSIWLHTWSLAIEEHFYFLLLLFLLALSSRKSSPNPFRSVPAVFLLLAIACCAMRFFVRRHTGFDLKSTFTPTHLRIDALFAGVFVSYLYHFHTDALLLMSRRFRLALVAFGIAAISPAFMFDLETSLFIPTMGLTLFYVGSAALMIASLTANVPQWKLTGALSYVGQQSYSIYLWHLMAIGFAGMIGKRLGAWYFYFLLSILLSIGAGIIMALIVEVPTLRLRDKWFPSRGKSLSV